MLAGSGALVLAFSALQLGSHNGQETAEERARPEALMRSMPLFRRHCVCVCRRHRGRGDGSAPATTSGVAPTTCFSLPPSRWRQLSVDRDFPPPPSSSRLRLF